MHQDDEESKILASTEFIVSDEAEGFLLRITPCFMVEANRCTPAIYLPLSVHPGGRSLS